MTCSTACLTPNCTRPCETKGMCHKCYNKAWRKANPEKAKASVLAWCKKNRDRINELQAIRYQKNHERLDELHEIYRAAHRKVINEQNRLRERKVHGLDYKPKPYVFYRDLISELKYLPLEDQKKVHKMVLSLPLTAKQRELAMLTFAGNTQAETCRLLKKCQPTLCKTWNGCQYSGRGKLFYGGIYTKFKVAVSLKLDWQRTLTDLNLRWE